MKMNKPIVSIVMGSDSDLSVMKESAIILEDFGISYEITICSAHRALFKTLDYAKDIEKKGVEVVIAGAGMAAHLAGVIAACSSVPVIGVPMYTSSLNGIDSLYSMVQMPGGVPVATVSIGKTGAKNAAILASQILALKYPNIKKKLKLFRNKMAEEIKLKDEKLKKVGYKKYLEQNNNN